MQSLKIVIEVIWGPALRVCNPSCRSCSYLLTAACKTNSHPCNRGAERMPLWWMMSRY